MEKSNFHIKFKSLLIFLSGYFIFSHNITVSSQPNSNEDAPIMFELRKSLNIPDSLGWSDPDPCTWKHISCSDDKRVTRIQLGRTSLSGTLPVNLRNLTQLERLELQWNDISGPLPSLNGLSFLQVVMLSNNKFSSIPNDFFTGLTSLQSVEIDNNPFDNWVIPQSIVNCSALQNFSANNASLSGEIPGFFGSESFPGLTLLHLAFNQLVGSLPSSFAGSQIQSLWLNGQKSDEKLSGSVEVLQNMTMLNDVWLHSNAFSGSLPDFSGLNDLEVFSVRDNSFTGPVPLSLINLKSLKSVNLSNNLFQGPMPVFPTSVSVDLAKDSNSFCLPSPGDCDPEVNTLLSIVKSMDYPRRFAENWKGNDPCADWFGVTCTDGNITVINFQKMGLNGTISPEFASLKSLERLILKGNNLSGPIPPELTSITSLKLLDVLNNHISGIIPKFKSNVVLNTGGNPDIGKILAPPGSPSEGPSSNADSGNSENGGKKSSSNVGVILFSVIGGVFVISLIALLIFCICKKKQKQLTRVQSPNAMVIHPRLSGSDNDSVKITVAGSSVSVGAVSESTTYHAPSEQSDIQMVEAGNMVISIQVLKNVTNNFSEENVLGQGGSGKVYKGELHDGTKIAVKRMEYGALKISEFKSEIAVLNKVRHRHLVALLGYCLDGDEKLLVYEYMPQGTLSDHLFNWAKNGLKPMEWNRRLIIALDVARGVEYLHSLAHQSFIHRDLKPSNILLGDDMRAKVADFGLVRLAPEGKNSIATRIAGTFGYLAPEYAVTGRVTTKIDVYSFGVILMELITGRKALDESQPEESMHLVTWFRRALINKDSKDSLRKAIDPLIDLDEGTLASISTVAELAGYCSAREPYQRPDMGHAVNVLSSLVELWKPSDQNPEDLYGIDLDMSLGQVVKKWQSYEGTSTMDYASSSFSHSIDNTQSSIPNIPNGFGHSFTSADGR